MSQRRLTFLINLISRLTPKELSNLKHYLSPSEYKPGNPNGKMILALEAIARKHNITVSELRGVVSPESSPASFTVFLSRLYQKSLESIILPSITNDSKLYSEVWQTRFEQERRLMAANVLFGKALYEQGENLLKQVLSTSTKYEFFGLQLECLQTLMNWYTQQGNRAKAIECSNQSDEIQLKRTRAEKARQIYFLDLNDVERKAHPDVEDREGEYIEMLQEWLKDSYSANLDFWYRHILINHFVYIGKFREALTVSTDFLAFLAENSVINTGKRHAGVCLQVAHAALECFEFKTAVKYAEQARKGYKDNAQANAQRATEYLIVGSFHSRAYGDAFQLVNKLVAASAGQEDIRLARHYYYRACIQFLRGNYSACRKDLANTKALDQDKTGWNLNIRIVSIMCNIELGNHDLAASEVENYYRRIYELEQSKNVRPRYAAIQKLFAELVKSGFQFDEVGQRLAPHIQLLASDDPAYQVRVADPELIAVDKWIMARIAGNKRAQLAVSFAA